MEHREKDRGWQEKSQDHDAGLTSVKSGRHYGKSTGLGNIGKAAMESPRKICSLCRKDPALVPPSCSVIG